MSIADELWEEVKDIQDKPFDRARPPKFGETQINRHGAVMVSMETAELICEDEEVRWRFQDILRKWERAKHEN